MVPYRLEKLLLAEMTICLFAAGSVVWDFEFGHWNLSDIWCLCVGISENRKTVEFCIYSRLMEESAKSS
jgi:hypothetical protein